MTLNSKFNILIADDHELILEGLKLQLLDVEEIKQVSIAKNKNELNNILSKNKIDIIFLDIHFGAYDGREIAIERKKNYPNILLAAFTSFDDKETIQTTINSGFDAFFLKTDSIDEMKNWLRKHDFEKMYISSKTKLTYSDFEKKADEREKQHIVLSNREKIILQLILDEKTTKQIAAELFLSVKTIENYRNNIMLKLDAHNLAGMVKKTILLGLLNKN